MGTTEMLDVRLLVKKEEDLYERFSPENEFNHGVKDYIRSKIKSAGYRKNFKFTVIYSDQLDEERFRDAVANWISEERGIFRQEAKASKHLLIGMLIIASLFITLSLALVKHVSVLSYTIIPVLGSVALGKAASICLTDIPMIDAKRSMLDEMEKSNMIVFEKADSE